MNHSRRRMLDQQSTHLPSCRPRRGRRERRSCMTPFYNLTNATHVLNWFLNKSARQTSGFVAQGTRHEVPLVLDPDSVALHQNGGQLGPQKINFANPRGGLNVEQFLASHAQPKMDMLRLSSAPCWPHASRQYDSMLDGQHGVMLEAEMYFLEAN